MTRRFACHLTLLLLALCWTVLPGYSQQSCPVPPAIQPLARDQNIFSDQQEIDLGDALAEQLAQHIKVIYDDQLNAYLQTLGTRLVQHLPATQMNFRFYLIELPEVNAFSIAGGRVYVARKMVALAKTDDELAGVLAHELGHIVTHQQAIEYSARLREVLGVTQVGDRADIFDKMHLLFENEAKKTSHYKDAEEKHQYVADQVALYAMGRAGYAPHAYVDLWDRFQQTHGKTGSWLSDFFGSTKPSEKRLREMLKNVSTLPAGCADIPPGSRTEEFAKWQTEVINYSGFGTKESLPGLAFKQILARPLRPDISNLRFSPDGKYVLAQDEGGIHVLTRDPFQVLFYFPAVDAYEAGFTPDSQSIVFYNRLLRVESWSISDQRRTSVHELTLLQPCLQSRLSPDGRVLGCLDSKLDLSLIDIDTGNVLVSKKSFVQLTSFGGCLVSNSMAEGTEVDLVAMTFSPDAKYFLVSGRDGKHLAWDLRGNREVSLPASVREAIRSSFSFIGPDRLIGVHVDSPEQSFILKFPSGDKLERVRLVNRLAMRAAAHGDFLLVAPVKNGVMGLFDIHNGTVPITFKTSAADVYDGMFVTEKVSGELALNALGRNDALGTVKLPQARLGALRSSAVSADFTWMAMSNQTRGAIWDIHNNIRTVELRSFHGAWFAPDQTLYVDFPKFADAERQIGHMFPATGSGTMTYKLADNLVVQHGPYLVVRKPRTGKGGGTLSLSPEFLCLEMMLERLTGVHLGQSAVDEDIEVHDVRDNHVIWSRYFADEVPAISLGSGRIVLRWSMAASATREEISKFPQLKSAAEKDDYLVEVIDLQKNTPVGALVIKTNKGSFSVTHVYNHGDWVVATASGNQVMTYSLSTGQEKSHFFGRYPTTSSDGLLALEGESGQLSVYDMTTSKQLQHYTFEDPISFDLFSPDGKRLFAMTANQAVYILDVTAKN